MIRILYCSNAVVNETKSSLMDYSFIRKFYFSNLIQCYILFLYNYVVNLQVISQ